MFVLLVFFYPNVLGHPDNYIPANSLVTPAHLVPEWYFLPFYAILRSVPNKLGGFICMFYLILSVYLLIILDTNSTKQNKGGHVAFFYVFLILMYLGAQPMETPYIELSRIMTFFALFWFPSYIFVRSFKGTFKKEVSNFIKESKISVNRADIIPLIVVCGISFYLVVFTNLVFDSKPNMFFLKYTNVQKWTNADCSYLFCGIMEGNPIIIDKLLLLTNERLGQIIVELVNFFYSTEDHSPKYRKALQLLEQVMSPNLLELIKSDNPNFEEIGRLTKDFLVKHKELMAKSLK
jgi:hypothetical protein